MHGDFRCRKITINRKRWSVRMFDGLVPPGETEPMFGLCDYTNRVIWIRRNQTEAEMLDTLLHELLHATMPHLVEREVAASACVIAKALTTCGVRFG